MANTPISGLAAGAPVTDPNLFANVQSIGAGPVKTTALEIKTYVANNLTLTGTPIFPQTLTIGTVTYTWPAANGAIGSVLTNNGTGTLTWSNTANGTVTSVGLDASSIGFTVSGSPVTSSGNLVITGGVLNVANGGTGASTPAAALINLLPPTGPSTAGYALFNDGSGNFYWAAGGGGGGGGGGVATFSGGTTGLTPAGATTGNVTLAGTLSITNGGTGVTSLPALQALVLPAQGGNAGKVLGTNGSTASWVAVSGTGTVTSVSLDPGTTGLTVNGGTAPVTITSSGSFALAGILSPANGGTGLSALGTGVQTALGLGVNTNGGFLLAGTGGVLPVARGGTNLSSVPTNGQILIGNGTGYTLATLTAGANVTIDNTVPGAITINATGGGGGGSGTVTTVGTTLSGITVTNPTTTPSIGGTLGHLSGGTGKNTAPTSGQLLIGNGAGYTLATLTAGTGVLVDNSVPGAITISATGTAGVSTFSGGSTGLLPNTATTGAITLSGLLVIGCGGTGLTTVGASGTTLVSNGTALAYGNPNAATNIVGGTTGQVPYQSAASTTLFAGPGAAGTYLAGNGVAAPTFKAATLTLGSTVLNLNTTTTALAGMTGITMAAGYSPATGKDVADRDYVDAVTSPINRLSPVNYATTPAGGNLTLVGPATVDGTAVTSGMRVLVKDQTNMATAGVYIVNTGGPWTRATDLDQPSEFTSASAFVLAGTVNANTSWIQTATIATVGTTVQVWAQQSGIFTYSAGTGISIAGTTINNSGVLSFSGGTTGLTPAVATTGAVTLGGTLLIANGGTSATTAQGARTNLLPTQAGNNGKFLQTNGTDVVWATSSGGAVYYINISSGGILSGKISAAGITDAIGNSYVLYNSTAANISLTATSFPNFASFTDCTATSITIGAGKTMMVSTTSIASNGTYAIDASNYLSGGVFVTSITGSTTMASILSAIPVIDNEGNVYVITNTGASNATISGLTIDNPNSLPGFTAPASVIVSPGDTVTMVSTVASTNFVVESITNSVATNLAGGAANRIAYQTAADTTGFLPTGTTGQFLKSAGSGAAPVWTTVDTIGTYYASITASDTVQNILAAAPNGEVRYSEYTIYNSGTSTVAVTNTSGWSNASSWPTITSGNNLNIAAKQSVTISVQTVGSIYAIVASSTVSSSASAVPATASGTITSVLTAGNVTENPGMLVTIRNSAPANASISLTGTLTNFEPFAPATSAASVIIRNGECVTLRVVTPGSAYDIVNLTNTNISESVINGFALAINSGAVLGSLATYTNTNTTGTISITAALFDNGATWPVQTRQIPSPGPYNTFVLPAGGTVTFQLVSASANNWRIVSFEYPGLQAGVVAFSARTNGSITVGTNNAYPAVVLKLPTIDFNPQNYYDATTGRFQPQVAGYYQVNTLLNSAGNGNATANSLLYKNGAIIAYGPGFAVTHAGTATISIVVYMNGTTDYLEFAAFSSVAWAPQLNGALFSASLVTQQNIINTNSGTYYVPVSANTTVPAALAAVTPTPIVDVAQNLYIFTNTASSNVTLTASSFIGYQAYPSQATATSIVLTPGATLELQTVTVGTGYQIVILNTPINVGSVAFRAGFEDGQVVTINTNNINAGVVLPFINTSRSGFNPQNYYNTSNYRFTPQTAGYYEVNASMFVGDGANGWAQIAVRKNGTTIVLANENTGGNGNYPTAQVSGVVYMNGTTDYLQVVAAVAVPNKNLVTTAGIGNEMNFFSAVLSNQTLTQVVGTTAAARLIQSASQAIAAFTMTKLNLGGATFDPQSWASLSNSRITPTIPGYYQINAHVEMSPATASAMTVNVFKNGGNVSRTYVGPPGAVGFNTASVSDTIYMNGTTDYLEVYVEQNSAAAVNVGANQATNFFSVELVGANQAVPAVTDTKSVIVMGPNATPSSGDYCIAQLDNIKAYFRQSGNANFVLSTVSGSMNYVGDYNIILFGGGAGWNTIPNNSSAVNTLTTTPFLWANSGSAGSFVATIREIGGAGRVYRITYSINFSYINSSVMIERVVG